MSTFLEKTKIIIIPYFIITLVFIVSYSFLNWLLFINYRVFDVDRFLLNFVVPFFLSMVPFYIWLRPKIKLLILTGGNGNKPIFYYLIALLGISIPTIIAQEYISVANWDLVKINNISEIETVKYSKYYKVGNLSLDKTNIGVYPKYSVSGTNNEFFDMDIFIAIPILTTKPDTLNTKCPAWLGVSYSKKLSNNLSAVEKNDSSITFLKDSQYNYNQTDFTNFNYLERIGISEQKNNFIEAQRRNPRYIPNSSIFLIGSNEPFENRFGNMLIWFWITLFGFFIIFYIMVLVAKFKVNQHGDIITEGYVDEHEDGSMISLLLPRKGYFITPIIININIFIFLLFVINGFGFINFSAIDLFHFGANYRPAILKGEIWRLITSVFLHSGLIHLVANMVGLLFIGLFLEPVLKWKYFAFSYILSGFFGSIASILWYSGTVSVGASGAIFGLYGVLLALIYLKIFPPEVGKALAMSSIFFVGYNLLNGIFGKIDNAAHIGGLISGLVIGLIMGKTLDLKIEQGDELSPETEINEQ